MRSVAVFLVSVFLALCSPGAAFADFDQSKAWFETLSTDERTETQANLILLGYYEYLVDGQFGTGTYQALVAFQKSQGRAATGALIEKDRQKLLDLAARVYNELGMDLVRDEEGQVALILPAALLTVKTPGERGNSYATPDGDMVLETSRTLSSERTFRTLYDTLKTPGEGRFILYSNYNDDRFVVSGKQDGRSFYSMFQNVEGESVGYTLTWTEAQEERASMLSIFITSHFAPLRYMPDEQEQTKVGESPTGARRFGVFELPENAPDTIVLNGEVTLNLASDFEQAIAARPDARILLLNSPGGYVDNALVVANEVHRRGMATVVDDGMGCYSACSYIFFAGSPRQAVGELGVHQISAEVADLVLAQTTLSDVLDALDQFGVEQVVITQMLRTPPEDMYVFSAEEIAQLGINQGGPIEVADITLSPIGNEPVQDVPTRITPAEDQPPAEPQTGGVAYVQLAAQGSETEAERSLTYARARWAGVLGGAAPEIERAELPQGTVYRLRVPARALENANAICAAIKSAGGGCYVTRS